MGGSAGVAGLCLAIVVLVLGGCVNGANPLDREPGVYKGAADPTVERPAGQRAAALAARFRLIQERE